MHKTRNDDVLEMYVGMHAWEGAELATPQRTHAFLTKLPSISDIT